MVGSSKILTVSYGTFSCTLEGFEDSFETMKAIAEYFRDLAADDRYFGAEPPTPDAEMLARIAEREIARRVEARTDGAGIVLRAAALPAAEAQVAEPAAPSTVEPAAEAPRMPPAAVAPPARSDSPLPARLAPLAETAAVDEVAAGPEVADAATGPVTAAQEDVAQEDAAVSAAAEPPAHPDADSVAAKLQRIRAVVGRAAATAAPAAAAATLQEALGAGEDEDLAPLRDLIAGASALEPAVSAAEAVRTAEIAGTEAAEEDLDQAEIAVEDEDEAEMAAPQPVRARVIRMSRAEFEAAMASGEVEEVEDEDEDFDDIEIADEDEAPQDEAGAIAQTAGDEGSLSPEDEAALLAELAAVEAEQAALDEEADQPVADAALSGEDGQDDSDVWEDDWSDEAEDENEIRAEETARAAAEDRPEAADTLARDEAILAGLLDADRPESDNLFAGSDDDDGDAEAEAAEEAALAATLRRVSPRRVMLDEGPEADEAAMSRLLSRTNERLDDPDLERRRQSIAQAKAAVAATEAARRLGETEPDETRPETPFREDLERVVRPRRPVPAVEARSERPKPAPLKLVAAQRVDLPAERPAPAARGPVVPVRPRRVTVEDLAPETAEAVRDAGNFAEFARGMGASSLNDLLEAAAAYTAYVEGMEDFSRPQLLNKVRAAADDFSREDGLRSFGTLLRQGRITKLRNGRFQVSSDTRFHPERRAG